MRRAAVDGKAWYEGLNLYFTSDDLEGLVVSLCNKEMTGGRVSLTSTREGFGRGLEMRVSVKEAEKIIDVPALWYDSLDSLRKFLAMKGNEYWATRVVKIEGVAKGDGETDMYAVMVGCAQYTNHYHCIKKFANARLKFYPEKGFTAGALVLEASSRNSTGLAAGSEVLINYGVSVSTDEDTSFGPDAKRFKGALDSLFARQVENGAVFSFSI